MASDRSDLLDVAAGSGGDFGVAKHHILGGSAAEGTHDPGAKLGLAHQHLLLIRGEPGQSLGLAPGHQGDLLDGVMGLHQGADKRVANLVIGDQALAAAIGERFALHAGDHPVHGVIDLGEGGGLLAAAGGEDRRFIKQVGQISASEARGAASDRFEAHIGSEFLVAGMHLEDGEPAFDIRGIHLNLAVETTRAHQGRIEHIGTVRGRDDNDAAVSLEAIHFGEQLVEGLLAFVITATDTSAALPSDRIDFIDEDQAGAVFLGPLEKIAHPTGAHTHKHLHEFGTRKREEGHTGLAGNRFGQKGLTGARRPHQQHTLGNLRANGCESFGGLQEGHDFLEVLLGFFDTGHIVELHAGFGLHREAGFCFAELHRLAGPTGHAIGATGEEHQRADQQQREEQVAEQAEGRGGRLGGMDIEADALIFELVHQLGCQPRQINPQPLNPVVEVRIHGFNHRRTTAVVDVNGGHAASLHIVEEAAVAHPGHGGVAGCHHGIGRSIAAGTGSEHLPSEKQCNGDRQEPEGQETPALIHGAENF